MYCTISVSPYSNEHSLESLSELKTNISKLYSSLNIDQHQVMEETKLQEQLESLKVELEPYERVGISIQCMFNIFFVRKICI